MFLWPTSTEQQRSGSMKQPEPLIVILGQVLTESDALCQAFWLSTKVNQIFSDAYFFLIWPDNTVLR